jgi:hypothetical protein
VGHKTDQRRYPRGTTRAKAISPSRARSLVTRWLLAQETAKRAYADADAALDELLAGDLVDSEIKLTDGRTATVVDQFAEKHKVFKASAFVRFKIEVKTAGAA